MYPASRRHEYPVAKNTFSAPICEGVALLQRPATGDGMAKRNGFTLLFPVTLGVIVGFMFVEPAAAIGGDGLVLKE